MNIEKDIIISPKKIETQPWQYRQVLITEMKFQKTEFCWFFVAITEAEKEMLIAKNFDTVREEFYKLSKFDFEIPDFVIWEILISGKSLARYALSFTRNSFCVFV